MLNEENEVVFPGLWLCKKMDETKKTFEENKNKVARRVQAAYHGR